MSRRLDPDRREGDRRRTLAVAAAALLVVLIACGTASDEDPADVVRPTAVPVPSGAVRAPPPDLSAAESETREDSVYPRAGSPMVDALHYHLSLAWTPEADHLEATERLTFRATEDARRIRLDFDDALTIETLTVDGEVAAFRQAGDELTIDHAVVADGRYVVRLAYSGTPVTHRTPSGQDVGWSVTAEHETWTMQQPYGAFSWYAVNDQPSDKAFYDFTLTVPAPWTGVANGELMRTTEDDGLRTSDWHLAEPVSAYLVTVTFADYTVEELESDSGVPITLWYPTGDPGALGETTYAPEALSWLERHLGPYPFDTFGIVIVPGDVIMETQTMVTLSADATSRALVVHELAHHWYGNTVSPADWRDVWMSEGWATYLHGMWEAEDEGISVDAKMDQWAAGEEAARRDAGPPGDYDPGKFLADNVYYGPALMLHELREDVGDDAFFELARRWPLLQENDTADREEYWPWLEEQTGLELTGFLEEWVLGRRTPDRGARSASRRAARKRPSRSGDEPAPGRR